MVNDSKLPHDTYPVVVSKLDPLVIRVSDLVLLVGSTSYTAKVKMGQMFNGYHIYVSSVGTPIYKQAVDISGRSTDSDNNRSEGSDAWRYIAACARTWMDDLEKSMTDETTQKNIVELLREMKFQEHFDMSGHIIDPDYQEKYGENFELCTEQDVYMKTVIEKIDAIYTAIYGTADYEGLNTRLTKIDDTLTKLNGYVDTLEDKLQAIDTEIKNLDTNTQASLGSIHSDLGTIKTELSDMNVTRLPYVADTISSAITSGLSSLVTQMNQMNTNITSLDSYVESSETGLPMLQSLVQSRTNSIQDGGSLYNRTNDIYAEVVNPNHGLEAIMGAASGGSGTSGQIYTIVSEIRGTVNGMSSTVNGMNSTVNETAQYVYGEPYGAGTSTGLYDFIYRRDNSIYAILCNSDSRFVDWVDEESRYVAHTHADI